MKQKSKRSSSSSISRRERKKCYFANNHYRNHSFELHRAKEPSLSTATSSKIVKKEKERRSNNNGEICETLSLNSNYSNTDSINNNKNATFKPTSIHPSIPSHSLSSARQIDSASTTVKLRTSSLVSRKTNGCVRISRRS